MHRGHCSIDLLDVGIRRTNNVINYYRITNLNHALNFSSEQGAYNIVLQDFCGRHL